MFFSRRIGLQAGRPIPIQAGARLTGQAGAYSIGALSIRTDADSALEVPRTTYNVVRVKRNILRRSSIGALVTHRSESLAADGSNALYGVDALLGFYQSLSISGYLAKTQTPGLHGSDLSYRGELNYAGDRYGLQLERMAVGDNFNPEVGFLRREDFRRTFAQARFSPRPKRDRVIRRFNYEASLDYITDNHNTLESRTAQGTFRLEFQGSDTMTAEVEQNYELVERAFTIADNVRIPAGTFDMQTFRASYTMSQQHRVSGTASFEQGSFWGGDKTTASFRGRVKLGIRFAVEPNVAFDWIDVPAATFLSKIVSTRATYNFSPRMFLAALVQYSSTSTSLSTNIRFRWEYQPGSEIFVVYTEGRDTLPLGNPRLENRGFALKATRLFRF
jgi:hypothetical protein